MSSLSPDNPGNTETYALIYVTGGSDLAMRNFCQEMLEQKRALKVEMLDYAEMSLTKGAKRQLTGQRRKMMILCPTEKVDSIFRRLPRGLEAIAVPVLKHMNRAF